MSDTQVVLSPAQKAILIVVYDFELEPYPDAGCDYSEAYSRPLSETPVAFVRAALNGLGYQFFGESIRHLTSCGLLLESRERRGVSEEYGRQFPDGRRFIVHGMTQYAIHKENASEYRYEASMADNDEDRDRCLFDARLEEEKMTELGDRDTQWVAFGYQINHDIAFIEHFGSSVLCARCQSNYAVERDEDSWGYRCLRCNRELDVSEYGFHSLAVTQEGVNLAVQLKHTEGFDPFAAAIADVVEESEPSGEVTSNEVGWNGADVAYITQSKAIAIAKSGDHVLGRGTNLSKWLRKSGCPVRYMTKGQRCNVHEIEILAAIDAMSENDLQGSFNILLFEERIRYHQAHSRQQSA
jgi:hypothetical protein